LVSNFALAFVSIFFAMDALGVLPIFISLTEEIDPPARRKVIIQAVITALLVGVGFVFFGKTVLGWLNVTQADFMVAGGALLFGFAAMELLSGAKLSRQVPGSIAAVPLGTPLIVGPAVLTASLMMVSIYGLWAVLAAVVVNVLLAGGVFLSADLLTRVLGKAGSRAISKVASLILAAIAVMMIRRGLTVIITGR
jgi:multiple antibiotic resistance protein